MPATFVRFSPEYSEHIYFSATNDSTPKSVCYEDYLADTVRSNLKYASTLGKPITLMFSGGVDSTYLLLMLREIGIRPHINFIRYHPSDYDNLEDYKKVSSILRYLGLSCDFIDCHFNATLSSLQDIAFSRHPFDKSFSVSGYFAMQSIRERLGPAVVINGQSADSIFCWGASSNSLSAAIQRFLASPYYLALPMAFRVGLSSLLHTPYRKRWNLNIPFRIPTDREEYLVGLLDPQGYLPIFQCGQDRTQYVDYLKSIVRRIERDVGLRLPELIQYMKLMYLQGPSNIMVTESAKAFDHTAILPFLDSNILNARMTIQNDFKNIFFPRYPLTSYLKHHFGFPTSLFSQAKRAARKDFRSTPAEFGIFERWLYNRWDSLLAHTSN